MKIKHINFWPALPILIVVTAAIASHVMANAEESAPISSPADTPSCVTACCEI